MPDAQQALGTELALAADQIAVATHIYTPLDTLGNQFWKGSDVSSAAALAIGAATTGTFFHVTGTVTITSIASRTKGNRIYLRFAGALTFTHNSTSLILPNGGSNITTAANDTAVMVSEGGGNWRCVLYMRADGTAVGGIGSAPSFTDFTNAQHDHGDANDGNALVAAAIAGLAVPASFATGGIPAVRAYNNANQSIANATTTDLTFNSERFDTDTMHSTVSNTERLTATTAGVYCIFANMGFASNTVGYRVIDLKLNGSTIICRVKKTPTSAIGEADFVASCVYELDAADYVTCNVYQTSGGALNSVTTGNFIPEFGMVWVAPASS
jgi:hypothetical protein